MERDDLVDAFYRFLFPKLTKGYLLRLGVLVVAAVFFFGVVCRPCVIDGASMRPTYPAHGFVFCWRPAFWFGRKPKQGQVVMARYAGRNVMLLKRVVALAGDTVEFQHGTLLVNGKEPAGAWAHATECDWDLPKRTVEPGHVYLIGDNRAMPIEDHIFGQMSVKRLEGVPTW